jgi:hypothetical protein
MLAHHYCPLQWLSLITIFTSVEVATEFYRQPVSVLVYNDVSSHFSKKTAAIFTSPGVPVTTIPPSLATAQTLPVPFNNRHNPSDVDYSAVADQMSQGRGNVSGVRLLTIKSPHRIRYSALEALLEALEDVIGRSLAGLPVEETKTYAVGGR